MDGIADRDVAFWVNKVGYDQDLTAFQTSLNSAKWLELAEFALKGISKSCQI